jgi:signal transduction histidine kinase
MDKLLHSNLQLVKGLVHTHDGETIECESNEFVQGEYVIPNSGHYYKVFVDNLLAGYSFSLPDRDFDLIPGEPESYDPRTQEWVYISPGPNGEALRVLRHDFVFMDTPVRILVAEDMSDSLYMIHRLTKYLLLLFPGLIVLIACISLGIAEFSLAPLHKFSSALQGISHKNLEQRLEENQVQELRVLAEQFNALLERLQRAFVAEQHLIGDAAHELKTPLAVIRAECDISLQRTRTVEQQRKSLENIHAVTSQMFHTIQGLITLTRLDSGIIDLSALQRLALHSCILDALQLTRPLAEKKNIALSHSLGPSASYVQGHREMLTEALIAILENSIKYNHVGGFVSLEVLQRDDVAEILIRDTGMGMKAEEMGRIFDRFYRAPAARHFEGNGLGLSIAQAILQAHGGRITVTASGSGGSRFTLHIPLARS